MCRKQGTETQSVQAHLKTKVPSPSATRQEPTERVSTFLVFESPLSWNPLSLGSQWEYPAFHPMRAIVVYICLFPTSGHIRGKVSSSSPSLLGMHRPPGCQGNACWLACSQLIAAFVVQCVLSSVPSAP